MILLLFRDHTVQLCYRVASSNYRTWLRIRHSKYKPKLIRYKQICYFSTTDSAMDLSIRSHVGNSTGRRVSMILLPFWDHTTLRVILIMWQTWRKVKTEWKRRHCYLSTTDSTVNVWFHCTLRVSTGRGMSLWSSRSSATCHIGHDADTALNNGVWMDRKRSRPGLQRSKALRICSM